VVNPPSQAEDRIVKDNYYDNPRFPPELENTRRRHKSLLPKEDYENIWEGVPRTVVAGAIYTREVSALVAEQRYRPMPYDPRLPVHTIWDLGWADKMCIIMVQKPTPSTVVVINYLEDNQMTYAEYVRDLNALPYLWGTDWLPHDADNRDPKTGQTTVQILRSLGRKKVMTIGRDDVEDGIRLARMMFPRIYLDNTAHRRHTGYLGGVRLYDCLRKYHRYTPKTTEEPANPVHDEYSHGADAFRYLAMIVDRIRNEGDRPIRPRTQPFRNSDPGMGLLG
jgi:phage terminase large subunit